MVKACIRQSCIQIDDDINVITDLNMDIDQTLEDLNRQRRILEYEFNTVYDDWYLMATKTRKLHQRIIKLRNKKSTVILLRMQALGWPNIHDKILFYQIARLEIQVTSMWSTCETLVTRFLQIQVQLAQCISNIHDLVGTNSSSDENSEDSDNLE